MKDIIKITIVASMFLLSSCEDFLNVAPQDGKKSDALFFQTNDDFDAYMFGAYAVYNGRFNESGIVMSLFMGGEIMQDITHRNKDHYILGEYMSPSNDKFLGHWKTHYTVVTRANLILDKLPEAPIKEEDKAQVEAEARFLRGFAYYHLASSFGDVPLLTKVYSSSQIHIGCSPEQEIWEQVINDLTYASMHLPEKGDWGDANLGRATKGAAYAFLALAYMNTHEWDKAEKATTNLIALKNYILLPDIRQVFNPDSPNSPESIFEIQFTFILIGSDYDWAAPGPFHGSTLPTDTAPEGIGEEWAVGSGWGSFPAVRKLANSFESGDERRSKLMVIPGEKYKGVRMIDTLFVPIKDAWENKAYSTKYWVGPTTVPGTDFMSDCNIIAMRYAEVILNYAEILFENGKTDLAYDELNKVRVRAKLAPLTPSTDKAVFMTALMKERRWELNFEPNLWYHYMRTGTAADYFHNEQQITMNPAWVKFPIPQEERNINPNLCQNDGY